MIRRCHFDALHCRWIDEWVPAAAPDRALAQTVRCYSPADLRLLLDGTGLTLQSKVGGVVLDTHANTITTAGPLLDACSYLARLTAAGVA